MVYYRYFELLSYYLIKKTIISVSKTVADTLLKYRCIWEDEEPIITEAPIIVDSPKDVIPSENKKTLLPDSSIHIHLSLIL